MSDGVLIPPEAGAMGAAQAVQDMLSSPSAYEAMCERAREMVDAGKMPAFFVPATRFILDATLGIMEQPAVSEQLPKEVKARAQIAIKVASTIAQTAVDRCIIRDGYLSRGSLRDADVGKEAAFLEDRGYLASIGGAPFYDVSIAVGGGLNLLREEGQSGDYAQFLRQSLGLLAIARLEKGDTLLAFTYLGKPYIDARFLRLNKDEPENVRVEFTEEAQSFLRRLYGQGCPTGAMNSNGDHPSLLVEYWNKIVTYLAPEDATVAEYQPQPLSPVDALLHAIDGYSPGG